MQEQLAREHFVPDQTLAKFKISRERYKEQFIALCGAGFTEEQANRLILKPFSNNKMCQYGMGVLGSIRFGTQSFQCLK